MARAKNHSRHHLQRVGVNYLVAKLRGSEIQVIKLIGQFYLLRSYQGLMVFLFKLIPEWNDFANTNQTRREAALLPVLKRRDIYADYNR